MSSRFASTSTEHAPSLSLVAASGTSIGLTVPPGGNNPVHLALRHDTMFPTAVFVEIILIAMLTVVMGGIVRGRFYPS